MVFKKAFTIAELIISLIVISIISYLALMNKSFDDRTNQLKVANSQISGFIATALLDGTVGYPSGLGGECSSGVSYIDVSAYRALKCSQLAAFDSYLGGDHANAADQKDGKKNYLSGFLKTLVKDGGKIYFDNSGFSSDEFYVYFDFSNTVGDTAQERLRNSSLIEEVLTSNISRDFSTIITGIYEQSTRVGDVKLQAEGDIEADGTTLDGKFGILFRN